MMSQTGSLTAQLRETNPIKMSFRLLFANWEEAYPSEREALCLDATKRTWVRCIEHLYERKTWVYARVVFPETTVCATKSLIPTLGIQPLGELIFRKAAHVKREPYHFCLLGPQNPYYPNSKSLWARRSVLYFKNQSLLITEIFMPESYATAYA